MPFKFNHFDRTIWGRGYSCRGVSACKALSVQGVGNVKELVFCDFIPENPVNNKQIKRRLLFTFIISNLVIDYTLSVLQAILLLYSILE
jgi:hypothetical protein